MSDTPLGQRMMARQGFVPSPGLMAQRTRLRSQNVAPTVAHAGRQNQMASLLKDANMRMLLAMKAVPAAALLARPQAGK